MAEPAIPLTKTSMTTDPVSLDQRPVKAPEYSLILKSLDVFKLAGSTLDIEEEVTAASSIWCQCGIEFSIAFRETCGESETRALLESARAGKRKPLDELRVLVDLGATEQSMLNLRKRWFSLPQRGFCAVFFAPNVLLTTNGARSAADPDYNIVYIGKRQYWLGWDLAHEIGHRLIGAHFSHGDLSSPLMKPMRPSNEIDKLECRVARGERKALRELFEQGVRREKER